MINKFLLVGLTAITLTACGGKGLDRKLNYSGSQEEFGQSYGEAMAEAQPQHQNILRERMLEILPSVLALAKYSNPAFIDAFVAKKNAEEFERVSNMTVRELFIWHLSARQDDLSSVISALEKFQNDKALVVEKITIENSLQRANRINIQGHLELRNDLAPVIRIS